METEVMVDEMNLQVKHAIKKFGEQQPWNHNFILADNIETRPGDFKSPAKNQVVPNNSIIDSTNFTIN